MNVYEIDLKNSWEIFLNMQ